MLADVKITNKSVIHQDVLPIPFVTTLHQAKWRAYAWTDTKRLIRVAKVSCLPELYLTTLSMGDLLDDDECATNPCSAGATCKNTIGSYECICPLGQLTSFTGKCKRTALVQPLACTVSHIYHCSWCLLHKTTVLSDCGPFSLRWS